MSDTPQDRARDTILKHFLEGPWKQDGQMPGQAGTCSCGQDFWENTSLEVWRAWAEHLAEVLTSPPSSDGLREAVPERMGYDDLWNTCQRLADSELSLQIALQPFVNDASHTRTFLTTREKMHPVGVEQWDQAVKDAKEAYEASFYGKSAALSQPPTIAETVTVRSGEGLREAVDRSDHGVWGFHPAEFVGKVERLYERGLIDLQARDMLQHGLLAETGGR